MLICDELDGYSGITGNQLNFFQRKGIRSAHGLMIAFCSCVNIEVFENIYKDFRPGKDYDIRCFKMINKHYLNSLEYKEKMLINQPVRIQEKHLNSLFPNLNIRFYVSGRSKYVHMGLDCALFTIKDYSGIIAEIKDFMFDEFDKRFSSCFPQLVHTVKWKYDHI